jgi:putative transcriptional regulator
MSETPTQDELDDLSDQPMTVNELRRARRVPSVATLRRSLTMTQDEFSAAYAIPLGTLRDWEQGRSEPDATARAYLKVISADPEAVARLLKPAA